MSAAQPLAANISIQGMMNWRGTKGPEASEIAEVGASVCAPWTGLSATGSRDAKGRRAIPIDYRKA